MSIVDDLKCPGTSGPPCILFFQSEAGKKNSSSSASKSKKAKAERKRSVKSLATSGSGKKEKSEEKEVISASTTDDEDDDEDASKGFPPASDPNVQAVQEAAMSNLSGSGLLNRQASRSTEDMFTPVTKKHTKWKAKKLNSKDDSNHTYSSSSSASSTTSSLAVATHSSSTLSAKPKWV